MPPPALASTTSSLSFSCASAISACICWTCFIIEFRSSPPAALWQPRSSVPPPLASASSSAGSSSISSASNSVLHRSTSSSSLSSASGARGSASSASEQHVDRPQPLADDRLHRLGEAVAGLGRLRLALVEGRRRPGSRPRRPPPRRRPRPAARHSRIVREQLRPRLAHLVDDRGPEADQLLEVERLGDRSRRRGRLPSCSASASRLGWRAAGWSLPRMQALGGRGARTRARGPRLGGCRAARRPARLRPPATARLEPLEPLRERLPATDRAAAGRSAQQRQLDRHPRLVALADRRPAPAESASIARARLEVGERLGLRRAAARARRR